MLNKKGFLLADCCVCIAITSITIILIYSFVLIDTKHQEVIKNKIELIDQNYFQAIHSQPYCLIEIEIDDEEV